MTARDVQMSAIARFAVLASASALLCACDAAPTPKAPTESPTVSPANTGAPAAPPQPDAQPAAPAADELALEGFDATAVCGAALDIASVPPVKPIGLLADKDGKTQKVEFVDGRFERGVHGASLRLAAQELKECSPFAKDGSIPDAARMTVAISLLEPNVWTWPNPKDEKRWRYWNEVVMQDDRPWTSHAGPKDKGLLVVDEVDEIKRRVKGRVLTCRDGGRSWIAGTFDVTLCDK